ncbi:MAG TPA: ribosome silencing factor [Tepidisphaeraceae bacterium]|jgi:ribosome-associated protein|nr:ribosome silencing factor [Tepidisphaeraceae bacterium]
MPTSSSTDRLALSKRFALEAARLASQTRGQNISVLDVSSLSPITDFYVIATGTSSRQMRTLIDQISELAAAPPFSMKPLSNSGYTGDQWILSDYLDVIIHVFSEEARSFYDLDNLWGDAKKLPWEPK